MNQDSVIFSIVIPTYNRPDRLRACFQALASLDYPRDRFEVLVVDDGSAKSLAALVDSFAACINLTLLAQPHLGPAQARNTGAMQAKGTFLAFTDDDCAPAADWLSSMERRFAATPDCAIGGKTINALLDNPYAAASQLLVDYLYGYYNTSWDQGCFFTSNNLAVPAQRFRALDGFDTGFTQAAAEDRDFCDRWRQHGFGMVYASEIRMYHHHFLTLTTFFKQHFTYGCGAHTFHRLRAQRGYGRLTLEPWRFYQQLLGFPDFRVRGWRDLRLRALLVLAQAANAAGFCWRSIRPNHNGMIDDRKEVSRRLHVPVHFDKR